MKNKKHLNLRFTTLTSSVFVLLCLVFFTSHFVLARDGNEDNEQNNTSNEHVQESENSQNEVENSSHNEVRNETRNETRSNRGRNENTSSRNETENKNDNQNETENETADNHTEDNQTNSVNNETNTTSEHGKSCEARQSVVTRIVNRAVARGNNIVDVFTKITTRTETFYVEKGHVLSNYEALVADVAAKKAAAQTQILTVQNLPGLTCPIADSKAAFDPYKSEIAKEIQALKDYKTAVKNLVEGVASVQPDDENSNEDTTNNTTSNSVSNTTNTTNEVSNETR